MLIVSERESGNIISFMSSRTANAVDESEMMEVMFAGREDLQCNYVDIPSCSLSGCRVEVDHGIVSRIYSDDKDIFKVDPEQLSKMVAKRIADRKKELLANVPISMSSHLRAVFDRHVYRLSHDSVKDSIDDGSYFDSDLTVAGWWGSFLDAGGYANMNREIVQRLHRYGVIPVLDIYPTPVQVEKEVEMVIRDYSRLKPKSTSYPYVYAFTPMPHRRHGGKRIFFTMMETSSLHRDFTKYCNEYSDEVWVPSESNRRLFASHGVKKNIRVMPLGIDEGLYFGTDINKDAIDFSKCKGLYGTPPSQHVGSYKFLTVIQWNTRKGYDALIKAFFSEFSSKDDVCLVISTQYSEETVVNSLKKHVKDRPDAPQVILYNSVIPVASMPYIYDACDCYVHMSRGEGFSLTQVEAGAREIPVISCFHSGMTEYMRDDNSYKIECNSDSPCSDDLNAISCYYSGQRMWDVGAPQIEQAAMYMRHVIDNREEALGRAKTMKALIEKDFTWEIATKRIAMALKL